MTASNVRSILSAHMTRSTGVMVSNVLTRISPLAPGVPGDPAATRPYAFANETSATLAAGARHGPPPFGVGGAPGTETGVSLLSFSAATGNVTSGALLGLGVAAFVDETVFHQLLHWHHFYDRSTPAAGLVSDGVVHAVGFFATVAALFLLADLRRRDTFRAVRWWAGLLTGAGAFQLYDGTIQHKVMRLHQIRYGVDVTPYDWAWNLVAALMVAAGLVLFARSRRDA
jgi:uncharacterized membrane protein